MYHNMCLLARAEDNVPGVCAAAADIEAATSSGTSTMAYIEDTKLTSLILMQF